MSKEAKPDVPAGLVRSLSTRWELNGQDFDEVDSNTQEPVRTNRRLRVRPRNNIPQLHNSFLQQILGGTYSELEVAGFLLEQEREGGPRQTSNVMTIKVLCTGHFQLNLIFKSINSASPKAKVLNFRELFKKEALMYSTVIPQLIAMHQDDPLDMFARSYHASNDLIVLDDLGSHGYRTGDHGTGLDAAHSKLVFAELGRFHATSYVLKKSDSTETTNALNEVGREVQFTRERISIHEEHLAQLARNTTDIIQKNPKTSRYAKQVEGILHNTYHHLLTFLKPREPFLTLTHGDLWAKNIMFRYSKDEPVSVKFLDFQTCRYGSPALDINYFLYTSTTSSVRERYRDDFIRTYHWSLSRNLHRLGLNISPSLADLRREVDFTSLYGFLAAHLILRDTFSDSNFEGDADKFFSERIADVVLDLGDQGVFEHLVQ
ncbi:hypothetical protein B7P43_G12794 [Cryptotermes secundus]|uniref:CHK kinase-like domain-containing protein n=1 Tax=Cryptotermes secundus TaxID=105785 RepID=A0A2J7QGL7_9NEOP|nr:uncharacterized protein LOC111867682 [Cryptotermes secundus]PNF27730.1 hypothetical protein B7P43_G12794 [Cryptotermes secundus]